MKTDQFYQYLHSFFVTNTQGQENMPMRQDAKGLIDKTRIGGKKRCWYGYSRQNTLYNSDRHRNFHATCPFQTHATCGGKIDYAEKWYVDQANRHFWPFLSFSTNHRLIIEGLQGFLEIGMSLWFWIDRIGWLKTKGVSTKVGTSYKWL